MPPHLKPGFLQSYLLAFDSIEGWFTFDAALLFMAYNQLIASEGITGDTLEIGVHHGLSAIAIAALRGDSKRFVAIDLFTQLQDKNVSRSGAGDRAIFEKNMVAFHGDITFVQTIPSLSSDLKAGDIQGRFSFCHVDGGHSPAETYHDLDLCNRILLPGGLVALDDYFNASFPGVSEGAIRFMLDQPRSLIPIAVGYNKVLFQKSPAPFDLNARFARTFPRLNPAAIQLWEQPALLFPFSMRLFFDIDASTPPHFVSTTPKGRARFEPRTARVSAKCGEMVALPVRVTNGSDAPFPHGKSVFGLSYHLLSSNNKLLKHDNARAYFALPLSPGDSKDVDLSIRVPDRPGNYKLEIDLVWEGVMWFKETGNSTVSVDLTALP